MILCESECATTTYVTALQQQLCNSRNKKPAVGIHNFERRSPGRPNAYVFRVIGKSPPSSSSRVYKLFTKRHISAICHPPPLTTHSLLAPSCTSTTLLCVTEDRQRVSVLLIPQQLLSFSVGSMESAPNSWHYFSPLRFTTMLLSTVWASRKSATSGRPGRRQIPLVYNTTVCSAAYTFDLLSFSLVTGQSGLSNWR